MNEPDEQFWSYIHDLYDTVASCAPEGKHAVVELQLADGESVEPSALQVHGPFLICRLAAEATEIVVVRQADVRRIRIHAVEPKEEEVPVGFRVGNIELPRADG